MIGGLLKSASSTALFASLGLIALGAGVPAAQAADLGGDCCADLEERVAELEATTARKGNRKVSLTISGQVTSALMGWDNGEDSDVYVVDPPTVGGTLFNMTGRAKISPSLSAGFHIQVGIATGARSHQVTEDDDDGGAAGDSTVSLTLANWYLDHKSLGRISVGRINTATAGVSGVNLGGTSVIANVNIGYWNRSFSVGNTGGVLKWNHLMGGNAVNGSTLSRANAISYTSPTFGGFSVSGAWGENDLWDVAMRYAGEFSGFRIAGAVGYTHNVAGLGEHTEETGATTAFGFEPNQLKASLSVMHVASGLYGTAAYVGQDNDAPGLDDTELWYFQGGISKNWTGLGKTAIYGEYAQVNSPFAALGSGSLSADVGVAFNGLQSEVWGVGIVQHIDAAAMEMFLSYRNYSSEDLGTDDMSVVMGGARIQF